MLSKFLKMAGKLFPLYCMQGEIIFSFTMLSILCGDTIQLCFFMADKMFCQNALHLSHVVERNVPVMPCSTSSLGLSQLLPVMNGIVHFPLMCLILTSM